MGEVIPADYGEQDPQDDYNSKIRIIGLTVVEHFWCPYCGGWHGQGPPEVLERAEPDPLPSVLRGFIRGAVEAEVGQYPSSGVRSNEAGMLDDEAAKIRQGDKVDIYWGGAGRPDGPGHGHVVVEDGVNASYVREPGFERDTPVDDRLSDPYEDSSAVVHDEQGRYDFS